MKKTRVEFQIEGSIEIDVPAGLAESEIDQLALQEVRKLAGPLSVDITDVRAYDAEGSDN